MEKDSNPDSPSQKLQEILDLEKQGYRKTALQQLEDFLKEHHLNAEAWYYFARFHPHPRRQYQAIQKALDIDPDYEQATQLKNILLEENPELAIPPNKRRNQILTILGIIALIIILGVGLAGIILWFFDEDPQPIVVIAPTEPAARETVPEPDFSTDTSPEELTPDVIPITVLPSLTPNIPALTPTSSPTLIATSAADTEALTGTETIYSIYFIPLENDTSNIATRLKSEFESLFHFENIAFEVADNTDMGMDENVAAVFQTDNQALAVIYGSTENGTLTLNIYADESIANRPPHPDTLALSRLTLPVHITQETTVEDFNNPGGRDILRAVIAYLTYQHQAVIAALERQEMQPGSILTASQMQTFFMLAYSYQTTGRQQEALEVYETLLTSSQSPDPAVNANRALAIGLTGDLESAVALYQSLMDTYPDPAFLQANIGQMYLSIPGQEQTALNAFDEAISLNPARPRAYVGKGKVLAEQMLFNDALAAFGMAIDVDSLFAPAYAERARLRMELGLLDEALSDASSAISLQPDIPDYHALRGEILYRQNDYEQALPALEKAALGGLHSAGLYTRIGQIYLEQGQYNEVIRQSFNALDIDPDYVPAWLQRGQAYLAQNELGSALNDFDQGLQRQPTHVDLLIGRCAVYLEMGDITAARTDCEKALTLNPTDGEALQQRGLVAYQAGNMGEAAQYFRQATVYDGTLYLSYYYLGVYAIQNARYTEAIDRLTAAIELNPDMGEAYALRTVAYRFERQWELGLKDARKALELIPDDAYPYFEIGLITRFKADTSFEQGDSATAEQLYEEAREALNTFIEHSEPDNQFLAAAAGHLNYIADALAVIRGENQNQTEEPE